MELCQSPHMFVVSVCSNFAVTVIQVKLAFVLPIN